MVSANIFSFFNPKIEEFDKNVLHLFAWMFFQDFDERVGDSLRIIKPRTVNDDF